MDKALVTAENIMLEENIVYTLNNVYKDRSISAD